MTWKAPAPLSIHQSSASPVLSCRCSCRLAPDCPQPTLCTASQTCVGNGWVVSGRACWPHSVLSPHTSHSPFLFFSPPLLPWPGPLLTCNYSGHEELWVQPALEMPKRRDILAIVLIILPWTLLITVWHQSTIAPLLAGHKGELTCQSPA